MNILVTNDDGYDAEGLRALVAALKPGNSVWVVAPASNRSGVSHGITMLEPIRFRLEGEQEYSCSGFPVDCAINGAEALMPSPPDVLVSGINRGANLGTDLVYSGTAAAARQASFGGTPAIAVSLVPDDSDSYDYAPLARFVAENLQTLISLTAIDVFVNVNAKSAPSFRGARLTGVSRREYRDSIAMHEGPDGSRISLFKGGRVGTQGDGASDWQAVEEGFVSVGRIWSQPVIAEDGLSGSPDFRV